MFERWRLWRACRQLRRELAWWGLDVSDLSDAELQERVAVLGRVVAMAGISFEEAAANLSRMAT